MSLRTSLTRTQNDKKKGKKSRSSMEMREICSNAEKRSTGLLANQMKASRRIKNIFWPPIRMGTKTGVLECPFLSSNQMRYVWSRQIGWKCRFWFGNYWYRDLSKLREEMWWIYLLIASPVSRSNSMPDDNKCLMKNVYIRWHTDNQYPPAKVSCN